MHYRQWKGGLFQFTDDVVTLEVSRCAGALLSRTLNVLVLKSLPKLLGCCFCASLAGKENYNNSIKKKEKLSNRKYGSGRLVLHWVDARTDPNY